MKTADLIPYVIKYANSHIGKRFSGDAEALQSVSKPRLWKRVHKAKVKNLMHIPGVGYDFGWEFEDVLDSAAVTESCIYRHFVNDVLADGLDAVVITDPGDNKILRICWHCD